MLERRQVTERPEPVEAEGPEAEEQVTETGKRREESEDRDSGWVGSSSEPACERFFDRSSVAPRLWATCYGSSTRWPIRWMEDLWKSDRSTSWGPSTT